MPIYEYKCKKCEHEWDVIESPSSPFTAKCHRCDKTGKRVVSVPGYRRDHTVCGG